MFGGRELSNSGPNSLVIILLIAFPQLLLNQARRKSRYACLLLCIRLYSCNLYVELAGLVEAFPWIKAMLQTYVIARRLSQQIFTFSMGMGTYEGGIASNGQLTYGQAQEEAVSATFQQVLFGSLVLYLCKF